MLNLVDKTFDQMAFAVQPSVILTHELGPLVGWNHGLNAAFQQIGDKMFRTVAPIDHQLLKIKAVQ